MNDSELSGLSSDKEVTVQHEVPTGRSRLTSQKVLPGKYKDSEFPETAALDQTSKHDIYP